MPRTKKVQAWRVEKLDRRRMAWVLACVHDAEPSARVCCGALLNHDHNARVRPFLKTVLVPDNPHPVSSAARAHRTAIAAAMSDRADALKRYKSPG